MTIWGIGTDILFFPRIIYLVKRRSAERLASRILSEPEHKHWQSLRSSTEKLRFLAVRWCVKEAAYKALQPGLEVRWKQTSFLKDPVLASRKPLLRLDDGIKQDINLHASVSHDGDYVYATVVAETNSD